MATTLWGIHTKDDHLFLNSNVIAIGWKEFGDLKAVEPSREAFKEHYESVYENAKKEASEPARSHGSTKQESTSVLNFQPVKKPSSSQTHSSRAS